MSWLGNRCASRQAPLAGEGGWVPQPLCWHNGCLVLEWMRESDTSSRVCLGASLVLRSSWLCHQEANCCKMRIPVLNQRIKIPQQFCIHQPPRVFASHDPGRMREQRHWWRQLRVSECKNALITTSDSLVCSSRNSSTRATIA